VAKPNAPPSLIRGFDPRFPLHAFNELEAIGEIVENAYWSSDLGTASNWAEIIGFVICFPPAFVCQNS
jgi:hypothetical protein